LQAEIQNEKSKVDQALSVLDNLHERDAHAYRMIFGMDPIDDNVRMGGIGGHNAYAKYDNYGETGEMMTSLSQRIDLLRRQVNIQSHSLDTILSLANDKETMLASMPSIKPVRSDKLARGVKLLSGFGKRLHPVFKVMRMHNGIDFTAKSGTPIQATGQGKVIKAGRVSGFGNRVVIDHGYGYQTLYAHMERIDVKVGASVTRGQQIGLVGSTGTSTAPHCHYEVHFQGAPVNPITFVMDGLSPEEYHALQEAAETVNQSFD
jgi:murein DD-endopeptidase MepM/ murein hydrolase activator NlpD